MLDNIRNKKDCYITNIGLRYENNFEFIRPIIILDMEEYKEFHMPYLDMVEIDTPCYFMVHPWMEAVYEDWFTEYFAYLQNYLDLKTKIKDLRLVISRPNEKYKDDAFRLVLLEDYDNILFIEKFNIGKLFKFKELYYSLNINRDLSSRHSKSLIGLSNMIVKNVKLDKFKNELHYNYPEKVYLSRKHINVLNDPISYYAGITRIFTQEDQLSELLINNGYVEIIPHNYSFYDEVMLFYNAKKIVGCFGAAFVNLFFCDGPNCETFEIFSSSYDRSSEIEHITNSKQFKKNISYTDTVIDEKFIQKYNIIPPYIANSPYKLKYDFNHLKDKLIQERFI